MNKIVYLVDMCGINSSKLYYDPKFYRDEIAIPYIYFREEMEAKGFEVKLTRDCAGIGDAAYVISFGDISQRLLKNIAHIPRERRILIVCEPPAVTPELFSQKPEKDFGIIFTYFDDQVDNQTYFKIYHPQAYDRPIDHIPDFANKKLSVMILGNKSSNHPKELYSDRRETAIIFANLGDFDLFGPGWQGWPAWKGEPSMHKLLLLKNYKFYLCYENMNGMKGHISERIFDAFFSGCVPVYWGASNITDFVPKECFVDRREFCSNTELYRFLMNVDRNAFYAYIDAGQKFINSPQMKPYEPRSFGRTIVEKMIKS
jgi:alpha(1,3/1,4) fucosyltransferase